MPTITNAFVIPGLSAVPSEVTLLVGLVVDERRITWGECSVETAGSNREEKLDEANHILQEIIIPALMGQSLANITDLMRQIDQMQYQVTVVRPVTAGTPPPKRSRRELFTSLLNPTQEVVEVIERPLPPKLRKEMSLLLFSAAAQVGDTPIVETIARHYSLKAAEKALPLHLLFNDLPNPSDPALSRFTAASYGLTISGDDPVKELGSSGIRFQNRLRQLKNRAVQHRDQDDIAFLFDMKGGLGLLYEQKIGSILGALNGLEQVVKPYRLQLVDPIIRDDRQGQLEAMKELKEFLGFRKMETRVIGQAWLESAADIHLFADAGCFHGVLLDMARLGTLHRTVELAAAARERGLAVILAGLKGGSEPPKAAFQAAAIHATLALNPDLLVVEAGDAAAVSNEITRTLAWQGYRQQQRSGAG